MSNIIHGLVKWFDGNRGFGFITPKDGSKEVFVHYSEIKNSGYQVLYEGQEVSYTPSQGLKGNTATNVVVLNG